MKMKIRKNKFTQSLLALFMSVAVQAQSGGTFVIQDKVISGGGGNSTAGSFVIDSTIGQTLGGESSTGGTFTVGSGFWAASDPEASPSPTPAISGTVFYDNAIGVPSPRFVSNVTITGTGSPNVMTASGAPGPTAGQYVLTGFGAGSYTVTPTKSGGVNAITSFDAAKIAQHVAGINILTGNQLTVADVSGNGAISSFDAGQIARFVAGSSPFGSTGTWRFTPVNRSYASVTSNVTGEDYGALLMGEVSGNWNNTGARPGGTVNSEGSAESSIEVGLPQLKASTDKEILVQMNVQGIADKNVISYEVDLRYDPSAIRPVVDAADVEGTVSRGFYVVTNATEPGRLRVVVYGATPISEDGVMLNLGFTVVGAAGSVSPLTFERIMFNEGETGVIVTDGRVELAETGSNESM